MKRGVLFRGLSPDRSRRLPFSEPDGRAAARLAPLVVPPRLLQLGWVVAAMACLAWAVVDPRFYDGEGFPATSICLPLSLSVALALLAAAWNASLRATACWLALGLVGQAVALQLITAGPYMRYQHYQPLNRVVTESPVLLIYLAVQSVLVGGALKRRWGAFRAWLRRNFAVWQLALIALVIFLPSATVSFDPRVYAAELVFAALVQALNLATLVAMVATIPAGTLARWVPRVERFLEGPSPHDQSDRRSLWGLPIAAAVWVGVLAALLSIYSYQRHPHIPDEVAYIYQARFLANGVLTMPAPPVPKAFDFYLMQFDNDRWYPSPPVGWPAVLALGEWCGVPWLVNPLLASLGVLLIYLLLADMYDRRLARTAVLLTATSPWYVFMGMNFMTHMLILVCALAAGVAVVRARRTSSAAWSATGGVATGALSITRPLEGVIIAGLLGLWLLGVRTWRARILCLLAFGIGTATIGGLVLPYNRHLTGEALRFPINAYLDQRFGHNANAFGFGPDRGMGWPIDPWPGHSPLDALVNADLNGFAINIELFGWSIGSFLFVALILFSGTLRRSDYLLLTVVATIFTAYFFYYFSGGPDFGARYWFLMYVPLIALTARGIAHLQTAMGADRGRVLVAAGALCSLALVSYFPWRAIDKYHHYLHMRPDIRELADQHHFGKSLVLIRGDEHPDYASAAVYNPIDLHADEPIYAWDRGPEIRAQLLAAYPDRPVWVIDGPTITHGAYRVIAGPVSIGERAAAIGDPDQR